MCFVSTQILPSLIDGDTHTLTPIGVTPKLQEENSTTTTTTTTTTSGQCCIKYLVRNVTSYNCDACNPRASATANIIILVIVFVCLFALILCLNRKDSNPQTTLA